MFFELFVHVLICWLLCCRTIEWARAAGVVMDASMFDDAFRSVALTGTLEQAIDTYGENLLIAGTGAIAKKGQGPGGDVRVCAQSEVTLVSVARCESLKGSEGEGPLDDRRTAHFLGASRAGCSSSGHAQDTLGVDRQIHHTVHHLAVHHTHSRPRAIRSSQAALRSEARGVRRGF